MAIFALKDLKTMSWVLMISGTITLIALIMMAELAFAGERTTTVSTYVVRTQEEREQTRWTLTEWLRIKERMKIMDAWIAMFSDPNEDKFSPEFNVSFLATKSTMRRKVDDVTTNDGNGSGNTVKAQAWMTNLISSKVGIRTLNVDCGFEAGARDSGILTVGGNNRSSILMTASIPAEFPSAKTHWYALDLRLFGQHIQDTSLVLKYGLMTAENSIQLPETQTAPELTKKWNSTSASGSMAGVELQFYVTRWLGLEGTAHQYRATRVAYGDHTLTGTWGEALGFIEIGILRLQAGIYEERWRAVWPETHTDTRENGYVAGVKILL
jgi:hypothetical protein